MVDWVAALPDGRPPLANFLFDGGLVAEDWLAANIVLQQSELAEWRLADVCQQEALLVPLLARRLRVCAAALADGGARYLHEGLTPQADF